VPIPSMLNNDRTKLSQNLIQLGNLVLTIPISAGATAPGASFSAMATSVSNICAILSTALQNHAVTMADRTNMANEFKKIATQLVTPP
jgi:hypothetical protein